MNTRLGGIEAGGTKFVCAVGNGQGQILEQVQFPTTTPDETLGRAIEFFKRQPEPITALGIGSFGPVDLHTSSPTYGKITTTTKPGWQFVDIAGRMGGALGVPVGIDTDVNTAALGEHRWGAAQGLDTFVYLTIGTGIGGGALVGSKILHGLMHPEMGHILIPHDRDRDPFQGMCLFHEDCFEGLACGPAIQARWGKPGKDLPDDHPAWPLEAHYLASGLVALIMVLSPQRIILGGGVMQRLHLFPLVRKEVVELLNGYIHQPAILETIDRYIVPPALQGQAGVLGAIALAQLAGEDQALT